MTLLLTSLLPLCALLGACVSVLPEPEAPRGLYAIQPSVEKVSLPEDIVVREFEAPELMGGTAMVSEDADGARRLVKSVEWAGRLTRQMQIALTDSFSSDGDGTALVPALGVSARYRVIGRIQSLLLRGETAECTATVSVTNNGARGLAGQASVEARAVALRDRPAERAQALKMAAEGCVAQMAAATADIVRTADR